MAGSIITMAQEPFDVTIERDTIPGAPGLQSFVVGNYQGKLLLMGGRTDGLHQRQPFASFLAADNNVNIFVVDPVAKQTWSAPLSSLSTSLQEQLQSTNLNFEQVDTVLYIIGGYGYSTTNNDHITYPNLTAVNVPGLINAIINSKPIAAHLRQITDVRMAVTGGYLDYLDGYFYLVGGHKFDGRYNPMGGPSFTQVYSDALRKFKITDSGTSLGITNYTTWVDQNAFHRRDYNLVPQMFPGGKKGFTAFSGVFRPNIDLPWLNVVDVDTGSYKIRNSFSQMMSQYHSAKMPVYDSTFSYMHTIFFGGMSMYEVDSVTKQLMVDSLVPFVNTISKVTRDPNDTLTEYVMNSRMPGLIGSGAEFIPKYGAPFSDMEILNLNALPLGKTHVGYIYGGIRSTGKNIFFSNTGTQSDATNEIYKVYVIKGTVDILETTVPKQHIDIELMPNPAKDLFTIRLKSTGHYPVKIDVLDVTGKSVGIQNRVEVTKGNNELELSVSQLPAGIYMVRITSGAFVNTKKLVVQR